MWVEGGDIHDELLDQLGAVLTAPGDVALAPSAAELEALATAVATRWPEGAIGPAEQAGSVHHFRPGGQRALRRLGSRAWRTGSVAAGLVVFSASAAAATGGVPLPRPVRVVAYSVGLPVDSPALDDTNQHIEELEEAVKANDKPKAEETARRLQTDLKKVPGHEKKEAVEKVEAALVSAAPLVAPTTTTTTTTAPTPPITSAPAGTPTTVTTTEAADRDKPKDKDKDKDKGTVTTTTDPPTTTTTAPESTTTTTAPETDETPSDGTPSGDPGTGTGDPGTGDPGTGGGDQGSTTPTTTPDGGTTTTTIPDGGGAPGGGDPGSTTTTTSSTTTTTMPPPDPGAGTQP